MLFSHFYKKPYFVIGWMLCNAPRTDFLQNISFSLKHLLTSITIPFISEKYNYKWYCSRLQKSQEVFVCIFLSEGQIKKYLLKLKV